jgi:hypothetical protein
MDGSPTMVPRPPVPIVVRLDTPTETQYHSER